ncbi:MAG: phosphopentomutase [Christensenellaceae bacterium]
MKRRVFLIVLDSFGIGALPDADEYGDEGSNTLRAVSKSKFFRAETLASLGLFQIDGVREWAHGLQKGIPPRAACEKTADAYKAEVFPDTAYRKTKDEFQGEVLPNAAYGRMSEASKGKDTTTGHWEIAGIISETPFPTYPQGFPKELLEKFSAATGRGILCNRPYSGTQVIEDFGKEHLETGKLIVYVRGQRVSGRRARGGCARGGAVSVLPHRAELLTGDNAAGRVIARPFLGEAGRFTARRAATIFRWSRRERRCSISLGNGLDVLGVGKISDIFAGRGLTENRGANLDNADGMEKTERCLERDFEGLCFVNLVDFDMVYGHRNDADGYAAAIARFDEWLKNFLPKLKESDVLMITADHGCDPDTPSTDHSREYVPVLMYGKDVAGGTLGTRTTFADVSATVLELFGLGRRERAFGRAGQRRLKPRGK